MGYDIHITRAENWAENISFEITAQEWLEIIKGDPELIPFPENGEYFVIWRGANKYPDTWFNWNQGNIFTKYPDKATFMKLYQIAQKLNAQVQGDDGEIYGSNEIQKIDDNFMENWRNAPQVGKLDKGFLSKIKRFLTKK
jgi:hypothetical protein